MKTSQMLINNEDPKKLQSGTQERPELLFSSLAQRRGEARKANEAIIQPVVTIDDLEALAQKLLAGIVVLKSYKYPLAIRRGVKPS
jgi:hypothetical protein